MNRETKQLRGARGVGWVSDTEGGEATGKLTVQGGSGAAGRCRSQSRTGPQVQQAGRIPGESKAEGRVLNRAYMMT